MTEFEYAAVFYGIVVGLALQNIFTSIHKLVEGGKRIHWHWMAPATALSAAILTLGNFWFWWLGRGATGDLHPNIFLFLIRAVNLGLLFLACAATLPDEVPERGLDLRNYYFENRHRIWGFSAAFSFMNTCDWAVGIVSGAITGPNLRMGLIFLAGNALAVIIDISLIFVRAPWLHTIWIVSGIALLLLLYGPMPLR